MWEHLLIGLLAIATGFGLLMLGSPNRRGGRSRFPQGSWFPALYPPAVMVFLIVGIAELIVWAATTKWWLAESIVAAR
jgi:hypothetical protein